PNRVVGTVSRGRPHLGVGAGLRPSRAAGLEKEGQTPRGLTLVDRPDRGPLGATVRAVSSPRRSAPRESPAAPRRSVPARSRRPSGLSADVLAPLRRCQPASDSVARDPLDAFKGAAQ